MAHEIVITPTVSGGELQIAIESTHVFVAPEELENADAVAVTITTPDGQSTAPVAPIGDLTLSAAAAAPETGAWLTVHRLDQVWSNTPDGWRQGDAAAFPDAVFTIRYEKFSKALIDADQADAAFATAPLGNALEIAPLDNPAALSAGDELRVRMLHDGAPVSGELRATCAGFSDAPMTFAYATELDADGEGRVKLWAPSYWCLRVAHDAATRTRTCRRTCCAPSCRSTSNEGPGADAGARARVDVAPVAIQLTYGADGPMAFAEVTVTAPDGRVFQRGRADREGRFAFVPTPDADSAAVRTVAARDGEGHDVVLEVAPGDALAAARHRQWATDALGWLALVASIAALCLGAMAAQRGEGRVDLRRYLRLGRDSKASIASSDSGQQSRP